MAGNNEAKIGQSSETTGSTASNPLGGQPNGRDSEHKLNERKPIQIIIQITLIGGGSLLAFGAVLDALSNALTIITPRVTQVGSAIAVVLALVVLFVRFKYQPRHNSYDFVSMLRWSDKEWFALIGVVFLLWTPYWIPPIIGQQARTDVEMARSIEHLKVKLDVAMEKATLANAQLDELLANMKASPEGAGHPPMNETGVIRQKEKARPHEEGMQREVAPGVSISGFRVFASISTEIPKINKTINELESEKLTLASEAANSRDLAVKRHIDHNEKQINIMLERLKAELQALALNASREEFQKYISEGIKQEYKNPYSTR